MKHRDSVVIKVSMQLIHGSLFIMLYAYKIKIISAYNIVASFTCQL